MTDSNALQHFFLLHWFIAYKAEKLHEVKNTLLNFSYETRHSSRVFCEKIITENILIEGNETEIDEKEKTPKTIGEHIANQHWFFSGWTSDPTISSMITMLDAMEGKIENKNIEELWNAIWGDNSKIVFHQLDMTQLNLPDELYIKMNSRGKPLTNFEYFKSQFSEIIPTNKKNDFNDKIDKDWYDLFWYQLFEIKEQNGEEIIDIAKFVDESFLRFFRYLTNILIARNEIDLVVEKFPDEISFYKAVYSNTDLLESLFEILDCIKEINFKTYFKEFFYIKDDEQSQLNTRLFFANRSIQLFRLCCTHYDPDQRSNPFSIGEQLVFYAAIYGIVNKIEEPHKQLRTIRNLIANSDDTVRKDNMHNLLVSVEQVMDGIDLDKSSKFNTTQVKNELDKRNYLLENEENRELLNNLEDNTILQGCTVVFDLDDNFSSRAKQFLLTFNEVEPDFKNIKKAMFSFGDYSQFYGSTKSKTDKIKWGVWMHYQLGSNKLSHWRELLTPSNLRVGFDNTKTVLIAFLDQLKSSTMESIIENYLESEETLKDWRYYYVKYKECRQMPVGYSSWIKDKKYQYHSRMMNSTQLNGQNWSPYLYCLHKTTQEKTSLEKYDNDLIVVNEYGNSFSIRNYNSWYVVKVLSDNKEELITSLIGIDDFEIFEQDEKKELRYIIKQNTEHIDIENRVEKGMNLIKILSNYRINN